MIVCKFLKLYSCLCLFNFRSVIVMFSLRGFFDILLRHETLTNSKRIAFWKPSGYFVGRIDLFVLFMTFAKFMTKPMFQSPLVSNQVKGNACQVSTQKNSISLFLPFKKKTVGRPELKFTHEKHIKLECIGKKRKE